VDNVPSSGTGEDNQIRNQFLAHFDAPAYVRRARGVQEAFDQVVSQCRQQREEWLAMVRLRLGQLAAQAGDWAVLQPLLADEEQLRYLRELHGELNPQLRVKVEPTLSPRMLKRALRELNESIEYFNQRWRAFLQTVKLTYVNEVREGYNRYYILEKECSVRSPQVARQGFQKLEPLTSAALEAVLPLLHVVRLNKD
jgi:hypothetical protein